MFGYDKKLHFLAGILISTAVCIVLPSEVAGISGGAVGFAAATVAGALKELRDRMGFGQVEVADFLATSLGGAVILLA